MKGWQDLVREAQNEVKGAGAEKARARAAINEFADWATQNSIPFPLPLEANDATVEQYATAMEHHRTPSGGWSKNGESALHWAKELFQRSRNLPQQKEPEMPKQEVYEEEMEDGADESFEDGADESFEEQEEEVEEAPPKKRKSRQAASPQQPIIVQMPASQAVKQRQPKSQQQAQPTLKGLLPRTEKLRMFKRDERGKRVLIDDYTVEDLAGQKLTDFIEDVVHLRFANEGVPTEYVVFEVDPRSDREKGPPFRHVIEPEEQQGPPVADPFRQVHQAMGLLRELQGGREEPPKEMNPAFAALQQQKAASGDTNGVLMMMMMEKLFANSQRPSNDTELLMKILDRLEGKPGREPMMSMPPPGWAPPPPPPVQPVSSAMDKVMELAVAKLAAPPPSTFEMAKELASVQQLLTGNGKSSDEVNAMRSELRELRTLMASKPQGGLEKDLETFEKVTTMVKSIAPQVNADGSSGGIGGFIKNILTPDVAKAIAGAVGALPQGAVPPQGPQPAFQSQPVQQVQQVAAQPPPPRDPNRPPNPPPPNIVEAARIFQMAQTPPARAEKFADFIVAMFTSSDPYYQQLLGPVVGELSKPVVGIEELKPARRLAMMLVAEQKPDWATPDFVDVCLASLGGKVGIEMPDALAKTAGAWTLDFRGNVVMLENIAKPVVEQPKNGATSHEALPAEGGTVVTVDAEKVPAPAQA